MRVCPPPPFWLLYQHPQLTNGFFLTYQVKAYGVHQIVATDDYYYTCGPTGFLRAVKKQLDYA